MRVKGGCEICRHANTLRRVTGRAYPMERCRGCGKRMCTFCEWRGRVCRPCRDTPPDDGTRQLVERWRKELARERVRDAAPELLAALEVLVDHASETYPHFEDTRGQRDIATARAAIAKAKGGV